MGYSQHTAVHQAASRLKHGLLHAGVDSPEALPLIQDALDRYVQEIDPLRTQYRLMTGEVVTVETLANRYEELRVLQANRTEWLPLWQWTQRLGLVGFVIVAIVWIMGLR